MVLAARLGLPFARLRAFIPDEMMATTLANALGRKHGLSVSALDADVEEQTKLIRRLSFLGRPSQRAMARIPSRLARSTLLERLGRDSDPADDEAEREGERAAQLVTEREQLESLVGTALVLAFFQVAQLVPVVRLAQLVSAANTHFEGVTTPAGWSFAKTQIECVPRYARLRLLILTSAPAASSRFCRRACSTAAPAGWCTRDSSSSC